MSAYLGMEVSKARLDGVLLRADPAPEPAQFENNRTGFNRRHHFVKKRKVKPLPACLEATDDDGDDWAWFRYAVGDTVRILNPARIKGDAERHLSRPKTAAPAAALIAAFCRTQQPDAWRPPPEQRELPALVRHWHNLTALRQPAVNRRQAGMPAQTGLQPRDAPIPLLDQPITAGQPHLHDPLDRHPHLRQPRDLLTSIPGSAAIPAFQRRAEIPDLAVFDRAAPWAVFAGLTPRQHRSGSSGRGRTRLSKRGSARWRTARSFPAMVAQRPNPILGTFAQRLRAAGKPQLVVMAAVMRKLLHLVEGILPSGQPFDPHFLDQQAAFS